MATVHQNSENFIQALSEASRQNQTLLQILAQTEYAKPSSKTNAAYIADLQARIAKTDKELAILHTITEDERKDHVKYRESTVKRFVYKLGGSKGEKKFSDKASKEEREFVEAWQKERERRESRDELDRALKQAESDRIKLEADTAWNEKAQAELDALYQAIFGGPTPELAGEDQLEDAVRRSTEHFHASQSQLKVEQQALEALREAKVSLDKAAAFMQDAERASQGDIFGMPFADFMERDALSCAQSAMHSVREQHIRAKHFQPAIDDIGVVEIDERHIISDILLDNPFVDMAQRARIKSSNKQMTAAVVDLQAEITSQLYRVERARRQATGAASDLKEARRGLQDMRAEAFDRLGEEHDVPPPPYQAV